MHKWFRKAIAVVLAGALAADAGSVMFLLGLGELLEEWTQKFGKLHVAAD